MRILFKDCTWWSANYWMPEIPTRDLTSHFWTWKKIPTICLVQGTKYQRNTKYLFKLRMASTQRIDKIPIITGYYVVRLRWVDYTQPSPQHVMPSAPRKTIHLTWPYQVLGCCRWWACCQRTLRTLPGCQHCQLNASPSPSLQSWRLVCPHKPLGW